MVRSGTNPPVANRFERAAQAAGGTTGARGTTASEGGSGRLPGPPVRATDASGIPADVLTQRIDQFLGARGYRGPSAPVSSPRSAAPSPSFPVSPSTAPAAPPPPESAGPPLDFVCEDDVRAAVRAGRKLVVSERAIITPAARDLAEQHRVFTMAPWRG